MFLFYNTTVSELPAIRSSGIRRAAVCTTLRTAQSGSPDITLVIESAKLPEPEQYGVVTYVPPEAIVNLDPYLKPKSVRAAGGVVFRGGDVVLIFRRGAWDLPKGKCNDNEADGACALREVIEETGITDLKLGSFAGTTVHGYSRAGRFDVKTTVWYRMETASDTFVPQTAESIERVECVPLEDATRKVDYPVLQALLEGLGA